MAADPLEWLCGAAYCCCAFPSPGAAWHYRAVVAPYAVSATASRDGKFQEGCGSRQLLLSALLPNFYSPYQLSPKPMIQCVVCHYYPPSSIQIRSVRAFKTKEQIGWAYVRTTNFDNQNESKDLSQNLPQPSLHVN